MSILVIQLAPRPRLRANDPRGSERESPPPATELDYATSSDGFAIESEGRAAPVLLPRASTVVAVLADTDVSWHRITLPKAPAARLRQALSGVLEEAVLEDDGAMHLAVAPQAIAGEPTWIAAVSRSWLKAELAALERANVFVDRVVPMSWPDDPPSGHFGEVQAGADGGLANLALTWAHVNGVATMRIAGGLLRSLLPSPLPEGARWSATPRAAAVAEQWLGTPIAVMTPAMRSLQAARSTWNLRQFDLATHHRGARALRDAVRQFMKPSWRPVRIGLLALAAMHLLGLNLWAWHQRDAIADRQSQMVRLLRATYPQLRSVLDAPVQMQRESEALRAQAGKAGEADLEPMLAAAASAWPADRPPVESVRYEPGRLTLAAAGWANPEIEQFRERLRPAGWQVEHADGRLIMSRAPASRGAAS